MNRNIIFKKGFTLAELLVVISIIGILASIMLVSVRSAKEKVKIAAGLQFDASVAHFLRSDIIGEWKFENNLDDTSGNNNNGNYSSGSPLYEDSFNDNAGKTLSLDGSTYVIVPYSSSMKVISSYNNDVTISFWMMPKSLPPWLLGWIFCNQDQSYLALTSEGALDWRVRISNNILMTGKTANNVISLDNWYHIVLTTNGIDKSKIFINGVEQELSYINWMSTHQTNPFPIYIGGYISSSYAKLDGLIDEVSIYNANFNLAQVRNLYAKALKKYDLTQKDNER